MRYFARAALWAALAMASVSGAQAAISGQGTGSLTGYRLIDLDPGDGLAPSITFSAQLTYDQAIQGQTTAQVSAPGGSLTQGTHNAFYDLPALGLSSPGEMANAVSTASSLSRTVYTAPGQVSALVSGQTSGFDAAGLDASSPGLWGMSFYSGLATVYLPFTLGANTAAVFSFAGDNTLSPSADPKQVAGSVVSFHAVVGSSYGHAEHDRNGGFTDELVVFNPTAVRADGQVTVRVTGFGQSSLASPVPEVNTPVLALLGAGLVGVWARRRRVAALGAIGLMGALNAHAVQSSAEVGITGYRLVDLNPTDSVAPSIDFDGPVSFDYGLSGQTFSFLLPADGSDLVLGSGNGNFVDVDVVSGGPLSVNQALATVSAGLRGQQTAPWQFSIAASGQTSGFDATGLTGLSGELNGMAAFSSGVTAQQRFTLGAGTGVIFTVAGQLSNDQAATGYAEGQISFTGTAGSTSLVYSSTVKAGAYADQLSFFNIGSAAVAGRLFGQVTAGGQMVAAAVPEADALALALVGAGVAGLAGLRGRSHRAKHLNKVQPQE